MFSILIANTKNKSFPAPHFNLDDEFALQEKTAELIAKKLVRSVQDVSEGGLFISLCESGFANELGFSISTNHAIRKDAFLFGEGQSRIIVTVNIDLVKDFEKMLNGFPSEKIGIVTSGEIKIDSDHWGNIDTWKEKYETAIENYLSKEEAGAALSSI
jgi:phosphoribosylformylglycinamidine synthase